MVELTKRNKYIPIELMIHYSEKAMTHAEIGQQVGCSASNVQARFAKVGYTPERLKKFKALRADIFAEKQRQMVNAIDETKLKKASGYQLTGMIGTLHAIERLERGESTQNIAYADMAKDSKDIDTEITELEAEIDGLETQIIHRVETPFETAKREESEVVALLPEHTQITDVETVS